MEFCCEIGPYGDHIQHKTRAIIGRLTWLVPHNWSFQSRFDQTEQGATIVEPQAISGGKESGACAFPYFAVQRVLSGARICYLQEFLCGLWFSFRLLEHGIDLAQKLSSAD